MVTSPSDDRLLECATDVEDMLKHRGNGNESLVYRVIKAAM